MRKLKKGFTLVELLVVIAILAILATVSVVGYFSFTEKANVSNDTSMTTQMNTVLEACEATEGKNSTAYDAFFDLEKNGITIDNLKPYSTGYKYVWNSNTDRIVLLDDNNNVVVGEGSTNNVDLFVPVDSSEEVKTYALAASGTLNVAKLSTVKLADTASLGFSIYLTTKFTGDLPEITASISVDTGVQNVSVTYSATVSNDVYVRTNGGDLTVSSTSGDKTLSVLGSSSTTIISGSANISIESEITNQLEITSSAPSITITSNANVTTLSFNASSAVSTTNIKIESNTITEVVATSTSSVSGITGVSVTVETVDASAIETSSKMFAGGYGTSTSPYLIETAEQFKNIGQLSTDMMTKGYYFALTDDIDLRNITFGEYTNSKKVVSLVFNGSLEGNSHSITVGDNLEYLFAFATNDVTVKNLTYILGGSNVVIMFRHYGTTAKSYNSGIFETTNSEVKLNVANINIEGLDTSYKKFSLKNAGIITRCQQFVQILDASSVSGKVMTGEFGITGSYYANTSETSNCSTITTLSNINVSVNLMAVEQGYNGVLLGGQVGDVREDKSRTVYNTVSVSNCEYSGTFIGDRVAVVFANGANSTDEYAKNISISNVCLTGQLIYNTSAGVSYAINDITSSGLLNEYDGITNKGYINLLSADSSMSIDLNDNAYTLTKASDTSATNYTVVFNLYNLNLTDSTYTENFGVSNIFSISISYDFSNSTSLSKLKYMTLKQAQNANIDTSNVAWMTSLEGYKFCMTSEYLIIDFESSGLYREFVYTNVQLTISLYAYDANGKILHIVNEK